MNVVARFVSILYVHVFIIHVLYVRTHVCEVVPRPECVFVQALNKLQFTAVCLIYLDSDAQLQMCRFHHCLCVLCVLLPQTRCLISLGWVMWRLMLGRMPHSSVSPRAKFRRLSPSSWRWGIKMCVCWVFSLIFAWTVKPTSQHLDNRMGLEIAGRRSNTKDKDKTFCMFGI